MKIELVRFLVVFTAVIVACLIALQLIRTTVILPATSPTTGTITSRTKMWQSCHKQYHETPRSDILPNWCRARTVAKKGVKTRSGMTKRFPDAIIIGIKKAGTGALLRMLLAHPLIKGPATEMDFWDSEQKLDLQWYMDRMPLTRPNELTIEKSPSYCYSDLAVERLYNHTTKIKILMIVRDPMIRIISGYVWRGYKNHHSGRNTLDLEDYILKNGTGEVIPEAMEVYETLYDAHYKRWADKFGAEQIHIVNGDELVREPVTELAKVETFLQIPHYFSDDILKLDKTTGFYCWKRFDDRHNCTNPYPKCENSNKGLKHPFISPYTMDKVKEFFQPHIKNFCKMISPCTNFEWCKCYY